MGPEMLSSTGPGIWGKAPKVANQSAGEGSKIGKSPGVARRGRKRSFEPRERKASCTDATWGCNGANQGCTWCKRLLGDLCGVGPKDLLHPRLTTYALVCNWRGPLRAGHGIPSCTESG